ncbi:MAG: hypothetical protein GWO86_01595 [Planctomycetes bacterium]|nr:hypothetical protein [Planctomycetota bacterium]
MNRDGLKALRRKGPGRDKAFVLSEVVVVVFIVAMFATLAMFNLGGMIYNNSFKNQSYDFIEVLKMAVTAAAETGKRYEIILDFAEQTYTLREITTGLVAAEDILEEEIILTGEFDDDFQLSYVMFDDGEATNDAPALFRAGKAGWQYGGKIVVSDSHGREYSIVINRLSRMIELRYGDVGILMPRSPDEMAF